MHLMYHVTMTTGLFASELHVLYLPPFVVSNLSEVINGPSHTPEPGLSWGSSWGPSTSPGDALTSHYVPPSSRDTSTSGRTTPGGADSPPCCPVFVCLRANSPLSLRHVRAHLSVDFSPSKCQHSWQTSLGLRGRLSPSPATPDPRPFTPSCLVRSTCSD